jgi:exopolysaccharide biosynthesis protein
MLRVLLVCLCALSTLLARAADTLPPTTLPPPALPLEETSIRAIAPGIELTTIRRNTPDAPLQIFITRVDPKAGGEKLNWKLKLATGGDSVFKFAPVSEMAVNNKAVVGINGGYFAFGGAALGAVKIDDEWIRLPLKNRTAVGFDEKGGVIIDSLEAKPAGIMIAGITGGVYIYRSSASVSNLNGFAPENGSSVLTPRFGSSYKLRADETAWQIEGNLQKDGKILSLIETGVAPIPVNGWLWIMRGEERRVLTRSLTIGDFFVGIYSDSLPDYWRKCPTILGAGPRLLKNGEIFTTEKEEEFRPDVLARGPRTAFGVDKDGHWIFLVCDGREKEYSAGLSIPELALEMKNAGAVDALCMDGGGSSTLVVNNEVINRPSDGAERKVPNAILVVPVEEKPK